MSSAAVETDFNVSANLHDLVKKILLAFCEVHVSFKQRLDIYGSIHVRSDDADLTCFVLNEHSYKRQNLPDRDQNYGVSRSVSAVNGNSTIETVCYRNSVSSRPVLVKTSSQNVAHTQGDELDNKGSVSVEGNVDCTKGKKLLIPSERNVDAAEMNFAAQRRSSDENDDDQNSSVHQGSSTDTWPPETNSDIHNNREISPIAPEEPETMAYVKSEPDGNNFSNIKLEPTSEDVIDLGSEDDNYEQPNEGMFNYDSAVYDNAQLYAGYPPSSLSSAHSDVYPQGSWMQSGVGFSSRDGSQFSAPQQVTKAPAPKTCNFCLKYFPTNVQLRLHIQRYHSNNLAPEAAAVTNWPRLQSSSGSSQSNADNSLDKKLTCSICMLSFRSLDGLRCHENSKHSRNKLYNCQFCSQSFLTRQAAYTHRIKFHRLKMRKAENTV